MSGTAHLQLKAALANGVGGVHEGADEDIRTPGMVLAERPQQTRRKRIGADLRFDRIDVSPGTLDDEINLALAFVAPVVQRAERVDGSQRVEYVLRGFVDTDRSFPRDARRRATQSGFSPTAR